MNNFALVMIRKFYCWLPLSQASKTGLKHAVNSRYPTLFKESRVSTQDFVKAAFEFKAKLQGASDFDQMRSLWLSTNIPYEIEVDDPYSSEYRRAIENLYEMLCECDYQISNELTSTKQSAESFEIGYPWVSRNLDVIANHIAATAQAFSAISRYCGRTSGSLDLIEFGAGWGNLAIPLARAGQAVTIVDIDEGFINRIVRHGEREGLVIKSIHGDFCSVTNKLDRRYDAAIFQSSFHHCMDFEKLFDILRNEVLNESGGKVFFLAEPISNDFKFPWGLRYDGESLWAIMCNKWLELGFRLDFFNSLCLRKGFFLSRIGGLAPLVGEGWIARNSEIYFNEWVLPSQLDDSWHPEHRDGIEKFSKGTSYLPSLMNSIRKYYEITIHNFSNAEMAIRVVDADGPHTDITIPVSSSKKLLINGDCEQISISGPKYVPHAINRSGDERLLSFAVSRIKLV